jgi:carbamate kinase
VSSTLVLAVGGNALAPAGVGSNEEQEALARRVADIAVGMLDGGRRLLLVHGNGPQVGALALAQEAVARELPPQPLSVLGAMTQGQIGFLLGSAIGNALAESGLPHGVSSLVTQVVVAADDPAFDAPSKPIGPFFPEGRARRLADARDWTIAAGGGGVPVVRDAAGLRGVEAVIDKDYSAALLGRVVGATELVLLTGVERVALDFGTPSERTISEMTVAEARTHLSNGQFPAGSMGPKVDAAIDFVEVTGGSAVITNLESGPDAIAGRAGTRVIP